ncbi:hypothetical protein KEM56_000405 [Ascosphaera pollenicola]|nr:hypothetical protein KEM56_000405 [Ascosphaera pollenicola]
MAASSNIATYASAQIFYSVGATGVQILNQVFIADSSGLLNRGILSKVPDLPFLATVWIGPSIAAWVLNRDGGNDNGEGNWRLGYAMWIAILPLAFLPLAGTLAYNARKAKRLNSMRETSSATSIFSGRRGPHRGWNYAPILGAESKSSVVVGTIKNVLRYIWFELDIGGLLLLSGGVALILIPLTMINKGFSQDDGGNTRIGYLAAMILLGTLCLAIFPIWETSKKCAPRPILSLRLLKQTTALAGCALAFFYFMAFYFSVQPYMYSYLQVVQNLPVATAGRTTQTFAFVSTIAALTVSMLIRHSDRWSRWRFHYGAASVRGAGISGTPRRWRRDGDIPDVPGDGRGGRVSDFRGDLDEAGAWEVAGVSAGSETHDAHATISR